MTRTPPKNMLELLLLDNGVDYSGLDYTSPEAWSQRLDKLIDENMLHHVFKSFMKQPTTPEESRTLEFIDGKYTLGADSDLLKNATKVGWDIMKIAKKHQVDLLSFPEFQGIDFNHDGIVSPQEIGSVLLAASMDTVVAKDHATGESIVSSTYRREFDEEQNQPDDFNDDLNGYALNNLIGSNNLEVIKQIARQLIGDNTMPYLTDTVEEDAKFVAVVKEKIG